MKKTKMVLIGIYSIFMIIMAVPVPAPAEVNVNIGIGIPLPPPLLIPVPPPIVPIPRTNVYFPPTIDVEILFFGGYWYRPYRDRWFRSHYYNGPWVFVEPQRVPRAIIALPPDYRHIPPGHRHIPYGQFKKSWRTWDRDRYWYRDHDWNSDYWHGKPSKYRDDGYGSGRPKPDKWDGGPPGHSGRPDKWDGGGPPGHSGKGDKGDKGDGGGPPGHQGKGKGH